MASRPILRSLMAGVAVASLSTAAMAEGWTSFIIFGDRNLDSGQHVSYEALFAEDGDETGDGRDRATNIVDGGNRGKVISQLVADRLGFRQPDPSQPASADGIPTPPDGYNYASSFYSSRDVLASITDIASTGGVRYLGEGEEGVVSVPGRTRDGLLLDPERRDEARGALILLNGGTTDLRETADVVRDIDGTIDIVSTYIMTDETERDAQAMQAADNIAAGAAALTNAGAGLVVVTNSYDVGAIPEVGGDNGLLEAASQALGEREAAAQAVADLATEAVRVREEAFDAAEATVRIRDLIATELQLATAEPTTDPATLEEIQTRLNSAERDISAALGNAIAESENARIARAEADAAAPTEREVAQRAQINAAMSDPTLIGAVRTAATDVYNARLAEQLRGVDGNVVAVDQHALFQEIIANPARFGLSDDVDHAADCLFDAVLYPCGAVNGRTEERLFVNGIELTTTGHALAADQIAALVSAPATLSAAPGIGLSSGRSIADTSRDQLSREQAWKAGVTVFGAGTTSRIKLTDTNGFGQSDGAFHGGVVGAKYVFANGLAVGASGAFQKTNTPGSESTMNYGGTSMLGTVFAGINTGPIFGSVTATYGKLDFDDLQRVSRIGAARIINTGETEGTVKGITAEAGLRLVQYDILRAGPIANFSHWTSQIDGYAENGWEATAVRTGDLESKSTRAGLGFFMEAGGITDGYGTVFRAKALYGHEFQDDTQTASVTPLGDASVGSFTTDVRGADSAPFEFGGEVVFGYGGVITTFGYDGLFGDVSDHRFRIGASLPLGG